ncbi:MAG: pentapeptide repeat-containing protein [Candidatus Thiodiazotropha endolucinida]|nr:pentapeptide repeat-containing protein [Candidatus Thiodiazotropha taylori]MCW4312037.1 pentapeptide repeat-containing protein [Candidatus Thiodiazotropha taylori]
MDDKTLKNILERHKDWLKHQDSKGPDHPDRAMLENEDLKGADLSGVDLSGADLRGVDLRGVDLRGVDLSGADLRRADLRRADLIGADLSAADLSAADLKKARLIEADLSGAYLIGAYLSGALCHWASFFTSDLRGAVLSGADLADTNFGQADLRGAILRGADLSTANLSGVILKSRRAIDDVAFPITENQLSGILFEDELIFAKEHRGKQGKEQKGEFSGLIVKLDAPGITPFNFSMLLVSIEATYNNIFYLRNTEENSLEGIERHLQPYYQGMEAKNQLQLSTIREGSFEAFFEGLGKGTAEIISAVGNIGTNIIKEIREFREQNHRHKQEVLDKESERKKTEAETAGILLRNENQSLSNELLTLDIVNESAATAKSLVSLTPSEAAVASVVAERVMPRLGDLLSNSDNPVVVENSPQLQMYCIDPMASTFTKLIQYDYTIDMKYVDSNDDVETD